MFYISMVTLKLICIFIDIRLKLLQMLAFITMKVISINDILAYCLLNINEKAMRVHEMKENYIN